jgi:subtilase family serine protease
MAIGALAPAAAAHAGTAPQGRRVVEKVPSWTARAHRVGAVPGSTQQQITAVLNLRDEAGAERLAAAVSTPASAQYGHYLTAAQWRARFAPTQADVDKVVVWLRSSGFTVTDVPANHRFVQFTGSAATTEKALTTSLSRFDKDGRTVSAPTSEVTMPDSLASIVAGIQGLDGSQRAQPLSTTGQATAGVTAKVSPTDALPPPPDVFRNATPCSTYYGERMATGLPRLVAHPQPYAPCGYKPGQIRSAYGVDQALSRGVDGRGVTVAVVDAYASPTILQDAQDYAARNDPAHPLKSYQFSQSLPYGYTHVDECGGNGWYGEETLDVEAVHATAPAANILYVGGSSCYDSDLDLAVNTVVDNNLAQIVTNSYGDVGEPSSRGQVAASHQTALQAAAQGVSLLFSSGDSGDEIDNTGTRQVDYEASDPMVTAVGGTALNVRRSGAYGWEQGWGTGKSSLVNGAWSPVPPAYLYGGGGGTSHLFPQPKYQKGVVPRSIATYFGAGPHRAVPDVAMVGDPSTGFLIGERQTFPDGSVQYSEYRVGGTSLSSPLFAGVVAVATQAAHRQLGFLNPKLYSLAGTNAFRDVNHGKRVTDAVVRVDFANGVDDSDGTLTSLRTLNQTGTIFTRRGYDDVTGVGSPNGWAFISSIR